MSFVVLGTCVTEISKTMSELSEYSGDSVKKKRMLWKYLVKTGVARGSAFLF